MSNKPPIARESAEWLARHRELGEFERVGYAGLGEQYNRWLYRLRKGHFLRLARRIGIGEGCRVLDIGSGTGFYAGLFRELGVRTVRGVDLSPDAVSLLRRRFPAYTFEVCDIAEQVPTCGDQPFDVVSAMDVLFHIIDDDRWRQALLNCAQAVAPGGLLLISDNFPPDTLPANASQSFHSLADYEAVLRPAGFVLRELSPVFFVSNGPVGPNSFTRRMAQAAWRILSGGLSRALRTWPTAGECLGAGMGAILTTADRLLQRQSRWQGYSTKVAVYQSVTSA